MEDDGAADDAADGAVAVAVDIVDASGVGADNLSGTHYLCYFHPT